MREKAATRLPTTTVAVRDDRVLLETRVLAVCVIPVLLTASIVLLVLPNKTKDLFAWPIQAHMSSFALAVPYAAGIYYFARLLLDGRWHRVAAGLLPVGAFVTVEGLATVVHWDRFTHDNPAFWLWAFLYLTTPVIVPTIWWRNRRTDPGVPEVDDVVLPLAARIGFLVAGTGQLMIAVFLVTLPNTGIDIWPWPLTPLTARSTAGWFAFGLAGIMLARETRWSAARVIVEAILLGLAIGLVSVVRAWNEFDTSHIATWVFLATLVAATVLLIVLYAVMERRRRPRRQQLASGLSATRTV
jgi:preprotein translocase subunit SecY